MLAQKTFGVLGHVDHGKTSLVKALTGMDTDRLEEEKLRGLSIVLGFAYIETKKGVIDFIDVPGHENFIRTMISGATGIDNVLLTVAANEGIKPQTVEHIEIARLLDIRNGLIVITKIDLVSSDECKKIRNEINSYVRNTFLEHAPLHETSIVDGQGIKSLRETLKKMLDDATACPAGGNFYLPLDRVFTIAGHGTVATGTLRNGIIKKDQFADLMPKGLNVRIRQMQVHKHMVETAYPGQRVAINLRHVGKDDVTRGDALVSPRFLQPTRLLDVELKLLNLITHTPKHGDTVRLLFGTTEVMAMIRILGNQLLEPGAITLVQFVCQRDIVVPIGESFIIRTTSLSTTIGGGRILDNYPKRHRRSDQNIIPQLKQLASRDQTKVIIERIRSTGNSGINFQELLVSSRISAKDMDKILDTTPVIRAGQNRIIYKPIFDELCNEIITRIECFHKENPSRPGQPLQELQSRPSQDISGIIFNYLMKYLVMEKRIQVEKGIAKLYDFNPLQALNPEEQQMMIEIEQLFKAGGVKPPELDEVLRGDPDRKRIYHLLTETGDLIPMKNRDINRTIVFHTSVIETVKHKLEINYPHPKMFAISDVRKLIDTTRKFAMPILEYFDSNHITIRDGDKRKLIRRP